VTARATEQGNDSFELWKFEEDIMRNAKSALVFLWFVVGTAVAVSAQTQVFVPGNASGYFGNPVDAEVAFVPAISVNGPATITVTYVDGTVTYGFGEPEVGPNGGPFPANGGQYPLQEAKGIAPHKAIQNIAALIGAFVPAARAAHKGFVAIDATKAASRVGIMPGWVFFVGESKTIEVKEAGTLFLGINDTGVEDNSGGFNVEVSVE